MCDTVPPAFAEFEANIAVLSPVAFENFTIGLSVSTICVYALLRLVFKSPFLLCGFITTWLLICGRLLRSTFMSSLTGNLVGFVAPIPPCEPFEAAPVPCGRFDLFSVVGCGLGFLPRTFLNSSEFIYFFIAFSYCNISSGVASL